MRALFRDTSNKKVIKVLLITPLMIFAIMSSAVVLIPTWYQLYSEDIIPRWLYSTTIVFPILAIGGVLFWAYNYIISKHKCPNCKKEFF